MGIIQSDHSKSSTLYIKVPNPIVTFPKLTPNENNFTDLRNKIHFIVQASLPDLPSNYWVVMQKLFAFLESGQSVLRDNIVKKSSSTEHKEVEQTEHQLTTLAAQIATLQKSVETLLQDGNSDVNRNLATDEGCSACQEIFRYISDENGPFYQNAFLACPCLIVCAAIIESFSKLWLGDGQRTQFGTTVHHFKEESIRERLDNIKMLRTQSVSFNVHDYSYEAQIRKDVTFGGKINDFYDTRTINEISFRDHPLNQSSDADLILAEYKAEVRREYEQFFGAFLTNDQ